MVSKCVFLHVNKRAIMCRRAVRVNSQLKSHKRFANAFLTYCQLVDNARLYCTNALEGPPKVHLAYLLFLCVVTRTLVKAKASCLYAAYKL